MDGRLEEECDGRRLEEKWDESRLGEGYDGRRLEKNGMGQYWMLKRIGEGDGDGAE
jgi:hypothetical protein